MHCRRLTCHLSIESSSQNHAVQQPDAELIAQILHSLANPNPIVRSAPAPNIVEAPLNSSFKPNSPVQPPNSPAQPTLFTNQSFYVPPTSSRNYSTMYHQCAGSPVPPVWSRLGSPDPDQGEKLFMSPPGSPIRGTFGDDDAASSMGDYFPTTNRPKAGNDRVAGLQTRLPAIQQNVGVGGPSSPLPPLTPTLTADWKCMRCGNDIQVSVPISSKTIVCRNCCGRVLSKKNTKETRRFEAR